jgi:hypothetical protein
MSEMHEVEDEKARARFLRAYGGPIAADQPHMMITWCGGDDCIRCGVAEWTAAHQEGWRDRYVP